MKQVMVLMALLLAMAAQVAPVQAAVFRPATEREAKVEDARSNKALKAEQKAERKAFRKSLREQLREARKSGSADAELILYVILALIIPPLAMFLYDGEASGRFWISLLLVLGGVVLSVLGLGLLAWLAFLGSVVYTLYVILSES
ncbi:MAG: YqaE/Pmp3 family membrane protein [Saprospiraceae bacterium]